MKKVSREQEFKARDKKTHHMSRDGLVERNETTGEEIYVSQRGQEFELRAKAPPDAPRDNPEQRPKSHSRSQNSMPNDAAQDITNSVTQAEGQPKPGRPVDAPLRQRNNAGTKPMQRGTKYQQKFVKDAVKPDAPAQEDASAASRDSGRLKFATDEKPPVQVDRKLAKASRRVDKLSGKMEKAQQKLPTRRKPRLEKEFDTGKGKVKTKLAFDKQVKSQRAHLKGAVPLRPVKGAANVAIGNAHRKIYQVQNENVGVEAGHKAEVAAEGIARSAYRFKKTAPYRKVAKLERKTGKANIKLTYRKALHDNPKLQNSALSRMWQKRKIKRQYAKDARKAKKAARKAKRISTRIIGFFKRHPVVFAIVGSLSLLFVFISSSFSSCSGMASGGMSAIAGSSYLAEDKDIDDAELKYTEWETDLQLQAFAAETSHPGYDEYKYNIADVGHNPYELMAYLTAAHQEFSFRGIQNDLQSLFDAQYSLTFTPEVEIRYRDVPVYDPGTGLPTGETVQEPYEWHILHVKLTSQSFSGITAARMDASQQAVYGILMETKGNRQYTYSPFDFGWMRYVTSYYGYRVHPTTGEKDYHKAVDIAVSAGTEILATHDGVVQTAARDASYGNYIVLEGENGLVTKYAHCQSLMVGAGQSVKRGDVIATVGSTGESTGAHLHYEIIKDGQYLNPLYFAVCPEGGEPEYGNPGAPMGDGSFDALLAEAQKYIGRPYVFGASGPDYFDCSGYIYWIFNQSGAASFGRTTAQGLYNMSTPVSDPQPGDLVFFHSTYSTPNTVTHVGLYIGGNTMIHCGDPIGYASLNTSYWQQHFYSYGRL